MIKKNLFWILVLLSIPIAFAQLSVSPSFQDKGDTLVFGELNITEEPETKEPEVVEVTKPPFLIALGELFRKAARTINPRRPDIGMLTLWIILIILVFIKQITQYINDSEIKLKK